MNVWQAAKLQGKMILRNEAIGHAATSNTAPVIAFRPAREIVKPAGANGHQGTIEGQAVVQ